MTNQIDISVLFDKPDLECRVSLFIEPLAPLSLVTSMPGAYYRSQREPSDFMIYGMLENLLGWHFTDSERNHIIRNLKRHHRQKYELDLNFNKTPVGYRPLLQHHLKIEKLLLKPAYHESYEDYWTQHLKDPDISLKSKSSHPKGSRNYDYRIESDINRIYKFPKEERDNEWQILYNKKHNSFPMYYQSPKRREFYILKGKYGYITFFTEKLLQLLIQQIKDANHPLYLGTNEGWIDINIERI